MLFPHAATIAIPARHPRVLLSPWMVCMQEMQEQFLVIGAHLPVIIQSVHLRSSVTPACFKPESCLCVDPG